MKTNFTHDEILMFKDKLESLERRAEYISERWKDHVPDISISAKISARELSTLIEILEDKWILKESPYGGFEWYRNKENV